MLQSCGNVTKRHDESSKPGAAASGLSELPYTPDGSVVSAVLTNWNFHPWSKSSVRSPWLSTPSAGWLTTPGALPGAAVAVCGTAAPRPATRTAAAVRARNDDIDISSGRDDAGNAVRVVALAHGHGVFEQADRGQGAAL